MTMMNPETMAEQVFFVTARISAEHEDGYKSVGTGFIYDNGEDENRQTFIVTNRHVIEGAKHGTVELVRATKNGPMLGEPYRLPLAALSDSWFEHRNRSHDLIAAHLDPVLDSNKADSPPYCVGLRSRDIPSESDYADDIDAIEDVLFIGYPVGIYDAHNVLPVARKAITASPLDLNFEGVQQFLIDGPIFPGSSGSPVLICTAGAYSPRGKGVMHGRRFYFLGILTSLIQLGPSGIVEVAAIPTREQLTIDMARQAHLGLVLKSALVSEMIESHFTSAR